MAASLASWTSIADALSDLEMRQTTSEQALAINFDEDRVWKSSELSARQSAVAHRQALIDRAHALQRKEIDHLELMKKRAYNASLPIARLPVEILVMILLDAAEEYVTSPSVSLGAVCHRWLDLVLGPDGAIFWADIFVRIGPHTSFTSALMYIQSFLSRSRRMPYTFSITNDVHPSLSVPTDTLAISHLLASEIDRCQELAIYNVASLQSFFPLTGTFLLLNRLRLDFQYDIRSTENPAFKVPVLFYGANFPLLKTMELSNLYAIGRADIRRCFGDPSITSGCKELVLRRFHCNPHSLVELLRHFPSIRRLELESAPEVDADEILSLASQPQHRVTLSALRMVSCCDIDSALLLPLIIPPSLEALFIRPTGSRRRSPDLRINMHAYPVLKMAGFAQMEIGSVEYDWGKLIALRQSLRSVYIQENIEYLTAVVLNLIAFAHRASILPDPAETLEGDSNQEPMILDLHVLYKRKESEQEDTEKEPDFLRHLETLCAIEKLRERVYGPRFRIQFSISLINRHPAVARIVSRFPGFLSITHDTTDWWDKRDLWP